MTDIAFVDVETGGLDPRRHPLIEVAIIQWPENELLHFSVPFKLSDCTEQALRTNKVAERIQELDEISEHPRVAMEILEEALSGRTFVGNNPSFDASFIEAFLLRNKSIVHPQVWHYHLVDIKSLVAGAYSLPLPWSTRAIAEICDVPLPENAHTAVADCEWNRDVCKRLGLLEDEPCL